MSDTIMTNPITFDIPIECIRQEGETTPVPVGPKAYKNIEMERMIATLRPYLDRTDKIGYAAARNTRILRSEAQEYFDRRERLVEKYGSPQLDDDGNPTGLIELRFDSPDFPKYAKEIEEWALIEHTPSLYRLKYEEAIGQLSGTELLEIDWMFED